MSELMEWKSNQKIQQILKDYPQIEKLKTLLYNVHFLEELLY